MVGVELKDKQTLVVFEGKTTRLDHRGGRLTIDKTKQDLCIEVTIPPINIYQIIPLVSCIWSEVFCLGRRMRFAELEFSVEYSLVRAPPSGGGSNAPRPAVSVPHVDVNADGCRARRARNCKNTACRGGILEKMLNLNGCNA